MSAYEVTIIFKNMSALNKKVAGMKVSGPAGGASHPALAKVEKEAFEETYEADEHDIDASGDIDAFERRLAGGAARPLKQVNAAAGAARAKPKVAVAAAARLPVFDRNKRGNGLTEEEEEAADASNGLAAETAACSTADIIVVGEPFSRLVNKSEVKIVRSQTYTTARIKTAPKIRKVDPVLIVPPPLYFRKEAIT